MVARLPTIVRAAVFALTFGASAAADDAGASARAIYQEGARLYNLGQYEEALRAFEEAYAMSGAKQLLFNIAQAHRLAGPAHCERALRAYESSLREDATASNRSEIEERIAEMRRCVERMHESELASLHALEARAEPSTTAKPPPPAPPKAPIVVAIAGGGLFAVGAGIYVAARIKFEHERANCPCPEGTFATWQSLTTASYILMATGGATAAAGFSWWIVSRPNAGSYAVTAGPSGMYVTGTF